MKNIVKHLKDLGVKNSQSFNPILITDIDGVLVRGNTPIPGTL